MSSTATSFAPIAAATGEPVKLAMQRLWLTGQDYVPNTVEKYCGVCNRFCSFLGSKALGTVTPLGMWPNSRSCADLTHGLACRESSNSQ